MQSTAPTGYYDSLNPHLLQILSLIVPGQRVLELGCAGGRLGAVLKERGAAHYTGVECVAKAAEEARGRLDEVIVGNIEELDLPIEPGSVDCLVCGDVLEHLLDPWATLKKCVGYVKPGGHVVASIPNVNHVSIFTSMLNGRWDYTDSGILDRSHLRFFTIELMGDLFKRAGISVDQATSCPITSPSFDAVIADLDALRKKYGMGSERFSVEARTFQWILAGRRMA